MSYAKDMERAMRAVPLLTEAASIPVRTCAEAWMRYRIHAMYLKRTRNIHAGVLAWARRDMAKPQHEGGAGI